MNPKPIPPIIPTNEVLRRLTYGDQASRQRKGFVPQSAIMRASKLALTCPKRAQSERVFAYHEAAHVVVGMQNNDPIAYVCLCEFQQGTQIINGRVVYRKEADGLGRFIDRTEALSAALMHCAGAVAEMIMQPDGSYQEIFEKGASGDFERAMDMAAYHLVGEAHYSWLPPHQQQECEALVWNVIVPKTEKLITANWKAVVAVGEALLVRRMLLYHEITALIQGANEDEEVVARFWGSAKCGARFESFGVRARSARKTGELRSSSRKRGSRISDS